jgi:hypothetical protein
MALAQSPDQLSKHYLALAFIEPLDILPAPEQEEGETGETE